MDSTRKALIVVLAKVLVWVMLLHGALMIAVGLTLVLDPFAFSSRSRGGMDLLLQCFGFLVVFAGALNMLAAVLFFWRSAYRWFWVYLAVIMNVLLCVVALMGYKFIYIRREFGSVWWSCYLAAMCSSASACYYGICRSQPPKTSHEKIRPIRYPNQGCD